jgi:hypothetical protein
MIRAVLLASATAATFNGFRAISRPSQLLVKPGFRRPQRMTDKAPVKSKRRMVRSPILVIRPSRSFPPLEFCRGTRPSQAAKSRPERKPPISGTPARMALAVIGPTSGAFPFLLRASAMPATKRLTGIPLPLVPPPPVRGGLSRLLQAICTSLATDHMKPTSSRAIAVQTTVVFLPRPLSAR